MSKPKPKSSITDVPNIDQIFNEGREPTEEEWKVWAENFKPKRITARKTEHETLLKKKKAMLSLLDKERKRREYRERKETGHKSWGVKYNTKRNYLYKYNKEYKAKLDLNTKLKHYRKNLTRYDYWVNVYRKKYKNRLENYASTFKIGEDKYVYGFTISQMKELSPYNVNDFNKHRIEHLFPDPVYEGYRFKNNKVSVKAEKFYVLTEAIAYFSVLDKHRKKVTTFSEDKKTFLKKKFWEAILEARKEFDEE